MRILVISEAFWPENFLINDLVRQWSQDGHHIEVLSQWPSYPHGKIYKGYQNTNYATENWEGITIHRFKVVEGYRESKIKKILNYWAFVRNGKKILRKIPGNFDHILVHQTGPLTQALPAVWFSKKHKIPLTVWTLDLWPDAIFAYGFPKIKPLEMFVDAIIKKVYKQANQILVSSRAFTKTVQKYAPNKNITYAPNWLMPSHKKKSTLKLQPHNINFTFTGNISVAQNLKRLIAGFDKAGIPNAVFNIVGDGSALESLKKQVEVKHIKNVVFHGRFPYEEMDDIMKQSDYLVMSLLAKGGVDKTEPFKLQSYLCAGKPILGAMGGCGKEIIEGEGLGICCSAQSVEQIAQAFTQISTTTPQQREKIAENCKKLRATRFDRNKIIAQINSQLGV